MKRSHETHCSTLGKFSQNDAERTSHFIPIREEGAIITFKPFSLVLFYTLMLANVASINAGQLWQSVLGHRTVQPLSSEVSHLPLHFLSRAFRLALKLSSFALGLAGSF